jgi:hypothetical protein
VADATEKWIGTKVSWGLKQEGDYTIVLFKHQGWKEPVEFIHHCSTKWRVFLMSLKSLLEIGKGAADPKRCQDRELELRPHRAKSTTSERALYAYRANSSPISLYETQEVLD